MIRKAAFLSSKITSLNCAIKCSASRFPMASGGLEMLALFFVAHHVSGLFKGPRPVSLPPIVSASVPCYCVAKDGSCAGHRAENALSSTECQHCGLINPVMSRT